MALSNIDLIMIKAKLSNYQKSARLIKLERFKYFFNLLTEFFYSINGFYIEYADLKSGVAENKANSVEVCSCPIGYFGSSCEVNTYFSTIFSVIIAFFSLRNAPLDIKEAMKASFGENASHYKF